MLNIFKIVILCFLFQTTFVNGQDMHFTQFYSSPLYLNPAFTGANVCSRATIVYRNQWPGVKAAYQSYLVSLDHYIAKKKIGVGLQFGVDNAGTGGLRTTIVNPSIAYETKINRKTAIRFGVQPGITIKSINFDQLIFADQIARGGTSNPSSITTVETPTQNRVLIDIGVGGLLYNSNYWAGASFFHLNMPNESFFGKGNITLPIKYSVHGGAKFHLYKDKKSSSLNKDISIVANYRGQGKFDQFDIGIYYSQYLFTAGIWYRGIPGLKAYKPGYKNNDAIAIVIGFQKDRLNIGYSYDLNISKLFGLTQGANEVTLSYQLCTPNKKIKRILSACPKF